MDNTEEMKSFPINEIPGAKEVGLQWLMASGAETKKEALELAAVFVDVCRKSKEELKSGTIINEF
jgi:hypothetical protein